ncbi:MAG: extracellular solute-binding protein [Lachnospiraceae bacterium]
MVTLKDVARDAGVSIATVSCCINGTKPVKPETKAKIMDSIEKLKYVPNSSARNLKQPRGNLIGVLLTDIEDHYHAEIFKGIFATLAQSHYIVNVAFSDNSPDLEMLRINDFVSQNVSGLILISCQPQNDTFFRSHLQNLQIPTVFIERFPRQLFVNRVGFDNYETAKSITMQLLKANFDNIAMFCGSRFYTSEQESVKGYRDALASYQMKYDESLVCSTNMSKEDAFYYALVMLDLNQVQAIISTSETMTQGIAAAMQVLGLRIPEDISLISYGIESWDTTTQIPGVQYTSRTAYTLGQCASELLIEHIDSVPFFEEKIHIFGNHLTSNSLKLTTPVTSSRSIKTEGLQTLRVLMVDLATAHSIATLSQNFTLKTNINIEFEFSSQDQVLKNILHDVNSNANTYDIYMYDVPWLSFMVQNSLVSDITEFLTQEDFPLRTIVKENLENCQYDSKYFGIPIIGGSQILFYRKDLFEDRMIQKEFSRLYQLPLRPPRTWSEFNGISRFFTRSWNPSSPTQYGTSFAGNIDEALAPELLVRLWSFGGSLWDSYNRAMLNTPENKKAFTCIMETLDYIPLSPFETSIDQTVSEFSTGQTAMLITYTEYASRIRKSMHNHVIGRIGYERLPGRTPVSIGWNLGLNPYTTKTESVHRYFRWLCNNEISYYLTILDGQSPIKAPYKNHELQKLYPWLNVSQQTFPIAVKRSVPYSEHSLIIPRNKIEAILCNVLRRTLQKGLTLDQALEKGQDELVELFRYYGYPKPLHFIK